MNMNFQALLAKEKIKTYLFDIPALILVFIIPSLSHLLNFPLYLLEPMRIILILAILHTNKINAFLLAISLPLISFLTSGHPVFLKSLLVAAELSINVWLFYMLSKKIKAAYFAIFSSIILSKVFYYMIKYLLVSTLLLDTSLISTPLLIQFGLTIILSFYTFIYFYSRNHKLT
jgi:hypothetical protein